MFVSFMLKGNVKKVSMDLEIERKCENVRAKKKVGVNVGSCLLLLKLT